VGDFILNEGNEELDFCETLKKRIWEFIDCFENSGAEE
jgi:hypothetical protein